MADALDSGEKTPKRKSGQVEKLIATPFIQRRSGWPKTQRQLHDQLGYFFFGASTDESTVKSPDIIKSAE